MIKFILFLRRFNFPLALTIFFSICSIAASTILQSPLITALVAAASAYSTFSAKGGVK